ncbi:MAG: DUF4233 domain-containing protein [Agromyces sp.]
MTGVRRTIGAIVLGFEFIVIFLGSLVLFGLDAFKVFGWPDWSALIAGGAVLGLTVLALATLRWPIGFMIGWLVQALVFIGGLLQPLLFVVGAMFGAIWWYGLRAANRIDRRNAAIDTDTNDS